MKLNNKLYNKINNLLKLPVLKIGEHSDIIDMNVSDDFYNLLNDKKTSVLLALTFMAVSNRMQWTDGYDSINYILEDKIDEAKLIQKYYPNIWDEYKDIADDDSDIDGRYFRDAEYNYEYVLDIARTNIKNDTELSKIDKHKLLDLLTIDNYIKILNRIFI